MRVDPTWFEILVPPLYFARRRRFIGLGFSGLVFGYGMVLAAKAVLAGEGSVAPVVAGCAWLLSALMLATSVSSQRSRARAAAAADAAPEAVSCAACATARRPGRRDGSSSCRSW